MFNRTLNPLHSYDESPTISNLQSFLDVRLTTRELLQIGKGRLPSRLRNSKKEMVWPERNRTEATMADLLYELENNVSIRNSMRTRDEQKKPM